MMNLIVLLLVTVSDGETRFVVQVEAGRG